MFCLQIATPIHPNDSHNRNLTLPTLTKTHYAAATRPKNEKNRYLRLSKEGVSSVHRRPGDGKASPSGRMVRRRGPSQTSDQDVAESVSTDPNPQPTRGEGGLEATARSSEPELRKGSSRGDAPKRSASRNASVTMVSVRLTRAAWTLVVAWVLKPGPLPFRPASDLEYYLMSRRERGPSNRSAQVTSLLRSSHQCRTSAQRDK